MKIDIEQRTPEWFAWRSGRIGASDIGTILGVNPYKTAYELFLDRKKNEQHQPNSDMQRGIELESTALKIFHQLTLHDLDNQPFKPQCFEHDEFPFAIASLDGYCQSTNELVEIKCPREATLNAWRKNLVIPPMYIYQVQWQLMVSGATKGHLFAYVNEQDHLHMLIEPDSFIWSQMIDIAQKFLNGEVPLSADDQMYINHPSFTGWADDYRKIDAEIKTLLVKKEIIAEKLKELLKKHSNIRVGQVNIRQSNVKGTIDYSKVPVLINYDLEPYRKPSTQKTVFTISKDDETGASF